MKTKMLRDPNEEEQNITSKHAISRGKSDMKNSFALFLSNSSLYEKYDITQDNITDVIDTLNGDAKIEIYCPTCGDKRIFYMNPVYPIWDHTDPGFDYSNLGTNRTLFKSI